MNIIIKNSSEHPIYQQIYRQLREQILNQSLLEGELLPSMRLLAKELKVSVITTKRAYEELERDGYIYTVMGKGSFVAAPNIELIKEEYLRQVELHLTDAISAARLAGISDREFDDIVRLLREEDDACN